MFLAATCIVTEPIPFCDKNLSHTEIQPDHASRETRGGPNPLFIQRPAWLPIALS
jgi:hypothetical protein